MSTLAEKKARLREMDRDSQRWKVDADLKDIRRRKKMNEMRYSTDGQLALMRERMRLQKAGIGRSVSPGVSRARAGERWRFSSAEILRGLAGAEMQDWLYGAIRTRQLGCAVNAQADYAALHNRRRGEVR